MLLRDDFFKTWQIQAAIMSICSRRRLRSFLKKNGPQPLKVQPKTPRAR